MVSIRLFGLVLEGQINKNIERRSGKIESCWKITMMCVNSWIVGEVWRQSGWLQAVEGPGLTCLLVLCFLWVFPNQISSCLWIIYSLRRNTSDFPSFSFLQSSWVLTVVCQSGSLVSWNSYFEHTSEQSYRMTIFLVHPPQYLGLCYGFSTKLMEAGFQSSSYWKAAEISVFLSVLDSALPRLIANCSTLLVFIRIILLEIARIVV